VEPETKPDPFTVKVNPVPPAMMVVGEIEPRTGVGLGVGVGVGVAVGLGVGFGVGVGLGVGVAVGAGVGVGVAVGVGVGVGLLVVEVELVEEGDLLEEPQPTPSSISNIKTTHTATENLETRMLSPSYKSRNVLF
jgi:hypothetical protein